MGGDLRGHPRAARLGLPHEPDGAGGREVGDMDVGARELAEQDIARHHRVLGRRGDASEAELGRHRPLVHAAAVAQVRVLGVADHGAAERQRILHRAAVELGVHHGPPVVGERDAARLGQLGELGQLLPAEPPGHGTDWIDADRARGTRLGQDVVRDRAGVVGRLRVRHAADGGEAAGGGGAGAGLDRLLVLVAGLAQVHVHVDEPWADDLAARVEDLGAGDGPLEPRAAAGDQAVLDEQVLLKVGARGGVDDPAVPDKELHGASWDALAPARRKSAAIRTATPFWVCARMTE